MSVVFFSLSCQSYLLDRFGNKLENMNKKNSQSETSWSRIKQSTGPTWKCSHGISVWPASPVHIPGSPPSGAVFSDFMCSLSSLPREAAVQRWEHYLCLPWVLPSTVLAIFFSSSKSEEEMLTPNRRAEVVLIASPHLKHHESWELSSHFHSRWLPLSLCCPSGLTFLTLQSSFLVLFATWNKKKKIPGSTSSSLLFSNAIFLLVLKENPSHAFSFSDPRNGHKKDFHQLVLFKSVFNCYSLLLP